MLSKKIIDALNKQVNAEIHSAYLYLAMSANFETKNLKGFSHWMRTQAKEELEHAMRIYDYVVSTGSKAKFFTIPQPPLNWGSPLTMVKEVYKHESKVTSLINGLVNLSISEKDHATFNMLQWFVTEQVAEEAQTDQLVKDLTLIDQHSGGLFTIDRELAKRTSD